MKLQFVLLIHKSNITDWKKDKNEINHKFKAPLFDDVIRLRRYTLSVIRR